jgi:hypothetical protein
VNEPDFNTKEDYKRWNTVGATEYQFVLGGVFVAVL